MILTILEFALVTLGIKILLGAALIYFLLPVDGECSACDGDTVPLQARRGLRRLGRLTRLERRWCLRCGRTMLGRRGGVLVVEPQTTPVPPAEERTS